MHYYTRFITLTAIAFLASLALLGCSKNEQALNVSLSTLVENPAKFNNSQVTTSGTVHYFETPMHYWIEDDKLNRVEILPYSEIRLFLGESVVVTGEFRFSTTTGRSITLGEVMQTQ